MQNKQIKILFIGDIFGSAGRRVLAEHLSEIREKHSIDMCIANGENVAGGRGITAALTKKLHKFGVDVITGGNHSFANKDAFSAYMNDSLFIRPMNFPPENAGTGKTIFTLENGLQVGVINLMGRIYFQENLDCPFRIGMQLIEEFKKITPIVFVDFHAEATSEKVAFATHADGMASAVVGTHTHVQTSDERILPGGTAYITDAGMTGPEESIIGMKKKHVLQKFILQSYSRFEPATGMPMINGVVIQVNTKTGKASSIKRIFLRTG